jgi:hypothetical protein
MMDAWVGNEESIRAGAGKSDARVNDINRKSYEPFLDVPRSGMASRLAKPPTAWPMRRMRGSRSSNSVSKPSAPRPSLRAISTRWCSPAISRSGFWPLSGQSSADRCLRRAPRGCEHGMVGRTHRQEAAADHRAGLPGDRRPLRGSSDCEVPPNTGAAGIAPRGQANDQPRGSRLRQWRGRILLSGQLLHDLGTDGGERVVRPRCRGAGPARRGRGASLRRCPVRQAARWQRNPGSSWRTPAWRGHDLLGPQVGVAAGADRQR